MKKTILLGGMLCSLLSANAQTTQSVNFNTYASPANNDLKNRFSGDYTFTQVQTSGITGGAVAISSGSVAENHNLNNWAALKDTLNINAQSLAASICFKYIPNTNDNEVPAKIKIQTVGVESWSMSDHLTAYYRYDGPNDGTLRVESISTSTSTSMHNDLVAGHWYKLSLSMQKGVGVSFTVSLHDLGTSGTATPVLVASRDGEETITDFYDTDYDVMVGITGSRPGGAEYLDNFSITGTFLHAPTGIAEVAMGNALTMPTLVAQSLPVSIKEQTNMVSYAVSDVQGRVLQTGKFTSKTNVDVSTFLPGNYLISFYSGNTKIVRKFVKL